MKKTAYVFVCFLIMLFLAACGVSNEGQKEPGEQTSGNASGIVLAGQEAPEIKGIIKSIEIKDEVIVTVDGQDVHYRLSDDAKSQIEGKEVEVGSEVTFTTFSIGDNKETIAKFIIK